MAHTPGPWHLWVGRRIVDIVASDRMYGICRMLPNTNGLASDDALLMSNARVLAAAPDLLAACEWQQWFEDECRILTEIGREERKREEHGEEPWFHWFSEWKRAFWLRDTARELRQAALVKAKGEPEC